jgi:diguanylate cyclase (GGDEF)-like protein
MLKLDLRSLILLLTLSSTVLAVGGFFAASYHTQRDLLIEQTLEANRNYAIKLADISNDFLTSAHAQLRYGAHSVVENFDNYDALRRELERLREQSDSFSLVVIVDAEGRIMINAPLNSATVGSVLTSVGAREALIRRRPLISEPYISASNRLVVSISEPLYHEDGTYLGYIAGLIHLQEKNILNQMLGEHPYRDGSYLYVVSPQSRLIYHKKPERLGTVIRGNPVVEAVLAGKAGSLQVRNSEGIEMLAGFAPISETGWGVVAQRPLAGTMAELEKFTHSLLIKGVPLLVLLIAVVFWISRVISRPLYQLASAVRQSDAQIAAREIAKVRSWYFEASQLKTAILDGLELLSRRIGTLNTASLTDPLTGLLNRRGVEVTQQQWAASRQPFALISIDIDHFKQVNDSFGHDVGDLTIQFLAEQMRQVSRGDDMLCRNGGEEFCMLLPDISPEHALQVAERLREKMESNPSPTGAPVTVSVGVAHFPRTSNDLRALLKAADQALYAAKHGGRNRVVMATRASTPGTVA